jgi:hypothetical protein
MEDVGIFMETWSTLWPFDIFYGSLVYFVVIWYFTHFGVMCKEKSGNPGPGLDLSPN